MRDCLRSRVPCSVASSASTMSRDIATEECNITDTTVHIRNMSRKARMRYNVDEDH